MREDSRGLHIPSGYRRDAAHGLTRRKVAELEELADRWQRARRDYIEQYWSPRYVARILRRPRALREERRRLGWTSVGLSVHYHEVALMSALSLLRGNWAASIGTVAASVLRDMRFTVAERRWLLLALGQPQLLQTCLERRTPTERPAWAADLDLGRLARLLRRRVIHERGPMPRPTRRSWFEIDTNLYRTFLRPDDVRFRGAWLAITGLSPRSRICIPLAGRGLNGFESRTSRKNSLPTLRVEVGSRITFHSLRWIAVSSRTEGDEVGIDKGYRTLLTTSSGDPELARHHGAGAAALIATEADLQEKEMRSRRRIAALERSLRNTAPERARRIRRRNLRSRRLSRQRIRRRSRLQDQVNQALNGLFREPDLRTIYAEALDFARTDKSRSMNRRLGRWLKGYLQRRLTYKAKLNGVELHVVNAAYTSQACPRCWFTSSKNRSEDRFLCADCGYSGSADAVAATNVLTRGRDVAIGRFASPREVKRILDARWQAARSGRAWVSNALVLAVEDGLPEDGQGKRREQLMDGQSSRRQSTDAARGSAASTIEIDCGAIS